MVKLKFPVLKKIEYFDIHKNNQVIKTFKDEINDFTWRRLQNEIGDICGSGLYHYSFKQTGSDIINKGTIRGIKSDNSLIDPNETEIKNLKSKINLLSDNLNKVNKDSGGINVEILMSIAKQSYETQINFLNMEISRRELTIAKLETKIENLENELNESDAIIDELKSKTGVSQYLELAQSFLKVKSAGLQPVENLSASNRSDIPDEILQLLGLVDYSRIHPDELNKIIDYMKIFIQKLPLKGN